MKDKVLSALDTLNFKLVNGPLPELHDRGIVELTWPVNGQIVRLGLQERETSTVLVDAKYYKLLPMKDRIAFAFHETLIRVWYDDYENKELLSTVKIANLVHAAMANDSSNLNARSVARYLCDAEIMAGEKSNFGLQRRLNMPIENSADRILPRNVVTFVYSQGRCDATNVITQAPYQGKSEHLDLSNLGPKESYTDYTWAFKAVDGGEELFFTIEKYDYMDGMDPHFSLQSNVPGGISTGDMDVSAEFEARLGLWTK